MRVFCMSIERVGWRRWVGSPKRDMPMAAGLTCKRSWLALG